MDDHTNVAVNVLIVDDEPAVCALLREVLSNEGFRCQTTTSGKAALDLLQNEPFDAIFSDLNMPGMSGLELLEHVRKTHPYTAFLMVTGVNDIRMGVQAMKQGAEDYLVKPFQIDAVEASLGRALEKKRLERELENYRKNLEQMVDQRTKQLRAAMRRIELTYDETLNALASALDLRDNETAGHSRRVGLFCLELAKAMGSPEDQLNQIRCGAYLHDIGKIGIPDAILLKPGKLTEEEKMFMQTHVRTGYDLVGSIAFLAGAAELVLTHHERYDGTGYPQGLMGKEIPLGSRCFAVADTLDAMTSDRPYRRALPFSAAREEIIRESGKQFDPDVVAMFLSIPEQIWANVHKDVAEEYIKVAKPSSRVARGSSGSETGALS